MKRILETDGFTLTEILTVLVLIGILSVLAFSKYDKLIANTKSIEAQTQLKTLYEMQKMFHLRYDRYSDKFDEIGFQPSTLMSSGGDARYKIEIVSANQSVFEALAVSEVDFDGDGIMNKWKVTNDGKVEQIEAD